MKLHISLLSDKKKLGLIPNKAKSVLNTITRRDGAVRTVTGTGWMTVFDSRQRIDVSVQHCDKTGR